MPGLGIDFSPAETVASRLWDERISYISPQTTPAIPPQGTPQRKMSRWSESTRQSTVTSGPSEMNSTVAGSAHQAAEEDSYPSYSFAGRGSDDSQASYEPVTPTDDVHDGRAIVVRTHPIESGTDSDYLDPRKAPPPPTNSPQVLRLPRLLPRQGLAGDKSSVPQSMLQTLSIRKKAAIAPAPLKLQSVASKPATSSPAIIHHVALPLSQRKASKDSQLAPPSPVKTTQGRQPDEERRGSSSKTPRLASISSVFKTIRKSISSESRKNSTSSPSATKSITQESVSNATQSPKRTAPSPLSSPTMRKLRAQPDFAGSKSADFGYASSKSRSSRSASPVIARPTTAPSERVCFPATTRDAQSPAPSAAGESVVSDLSALPVFSQQEPSVDFAVAYSNPWQMGGFKADSAYAVPESPLSPGQSASCSPNWSEANHTSAARAYKQSILARTEETPQPESTRGVEGFSTKSKKTKTSKRKIPASPPISELPRSMMSELSQACSPELSPFQPATRGQTDAHRRRSSARTIERDVEQATAPHIYFPTAGDMALRDPWAPVSRPSSPSGQRRASKDAKGSRSRRSSQQQRRRSSVAPFRPVASPTAPDPKGWLSPFDIASPAPIFEVPLQSPDPATAIAIKAEDLQGSPVLVQSAMAELLESPLPSFRNPFLASLSATSSPGPQTAIPVLVPRRESSRRPSFLNERPSTAERRSSRTPKRKSSAAIDSRRQSTNSVNSNQSVPSGPSVLETRRGTSISHRVGIRVSIDAASDV